MDKRQKRKRTKTRRYISTDDDKYQYKKSKKNNNKALAVFDCIKKAMAENYDEESEKHSNSETSADSTDEDEQREMVTTDKEYIQNSSLPCEDQNTSKTDTIHTLLNVGQPHTNEYRSTHMCRYEETETSELQSSKNQSNSSNDFMQYSCNNELPSATSTCTSISSDSSLSQMSHSIIPNFNTFPAVSEQNTALLVQDNTQEQVNNTQQLQNKSANDQHSISHDSNAIKTGIIQELKRMIEGGFHAINKILRNQEQHLNEINLQLKRNNDTSIPKKPEYFPMQSVECLDKFENCSIEEYQNTVSYFIFLGGLNPKECVTAMIKESITDDFSVNITWSGYGNTVEIASRKLTRAIYEALARNNNFPKPMVTELQEAITEGLRNAKQRVRNREKEKNDKREKGKRRVLTEKVKENLNIIN
ncbi:uncharacterized protein [Linepithema humile]|uniref:uncharacterized protein n=1 Tax=Linepithema humile TaxID=83485 RepID=UPI00351ED232